MRTLIAWLMLFSVSHAATYYVDVATGSNSDSGASEALAWADPGYAAQQMGDADICYVKSGTYTVTTTTPGAAGPVKFAQASLRARMEGYSVTPGDRCAGGSKPIISADASLNPGAACNLVEAVGAINEPHVFVALRVDANSEPNTVCFKGGNVDNAFFISCEAVEAAGDGFNTATCTQCYAASNGGDGMDTVVPLFCYAESNTGVGIIFGTGDGGFSIARANGAGGINVGFSNLAIGLVAYGNTTYGINLARNNTLINSVAVNNTDDGFETVDSAMLINCADYNNTAGRFGTTPMLDQSVVTLSGDPFVDAANDDFTPNTTSGAGALLRGAGLQAYGQTSHIDVGTVQIQWESSGATPFPQVIISQLAPSRLR